MSLHQIIDDVLHIQSLFDLTLANTGLSANVISYTFTELHLLLTNIANEPLGDHLLDTPLIYQVLSPFVNLLTSPKRLCDSTIKRLIIQTLSSWIQQDKLLGMIQTYASHSRSTEIRSNILQDGCTNQYCMDQSAQYGLGGVDSSDSDLHASQQAPRRGQIEGEDESRIIDLLKRESINQIIQACLICLNDCDSTKPYLIVPEIGPFTLLSQTAPTGVRTSHIAGVDDLTAQTILPSHMYLKQQQQQQSQQGSNPTAPPLPCSPSDGDSSSLLRYQEPIPSALLTTISENMYGFDVNRVFTDSDTHLLFVLLDFFDILFVYCTRNMITLPMVTIWHAMGFLVTLHVSDTLTAATRKQVAPPLQSLVRYITHCLVSSPVEISDYSYTTIQQGSASSSVHILSPGLAAEAVDPHQDIPLQPGGLVNFFNFRKCSLYIVANMHRLYLPLIELPPVPLFLTDASVSLTKLSMGGFVSVLLTILAHYVTLPLQAVPQTATSNGTGAARDSAALQSQGGDSKSDGAFGPSGEGLSLAGRPLSSSSLTTTSHAQAAQQYLASGCIVISLPEHQHSLSLLALRLLKEFLHHAGVLYNPVITVALSRAVLPAISQIASHRTSITTSLVLRILILLADSPLCVIDSITTLTSLLIPILEDICSLVQTLIHYPYIDLIVELGINVTQQAAHLSKVLQPASKTADNGGYSMDDPIQCLAPFMQAYTRFDSNYIETVLSIITEVFQTPRIVSQLMLLGDCNLVGVNTMMGLIQRLCMLAMGSFTTVDRYIIADFPTARAYPSVGSTTMVEHLKSLQRHPPARSKGKSVHSTIGPLALTQLTPPVQRAISDNISHTVLVPLLQFLFDDYDDAMRRYPGTGSFQKTPSSSSSNPQRLIDIIQADDIEPDVKAVEYFLEKQCYPDEVESASNRAMSVNTIQSIRQHLYHHLVALRDELKTEAPHQHQENQPKDGDDALTKYTNVSKGDFNQSYTVLPHISNPKTLQKAIAVFESKPRSIDHILAFLFSQSTAFTTYLPYHPNVLRQIKPPSSLPAHDPSFDTHYQGPFHQLLALPRSAIAEFSINTMLSGSARDHPTSKDLHAPWTQPTHILNLLFCDPSKYALNTTCFTTLYLSLYHIQSLSLASLVACVTTMNHLFASNMTSFLSAAQETHSHSMNDYKPPSTTTRALMMSPGAPLTTAAFDILSYTVTPSSLPAPQATAVDGLPQLFTLFPHSTSPSMHTFSLKQHMELAAQLFNTHKDKSIAMLVACGFLPPRPSPYDLAMFILFTTGLSKTAIGEVISSSDPVNKTIIECLCKVVMYNGGGVRIRTSTQRRRSKSWKGTVQQQHQHSQDQGRASSPRQVDLIVDGISSTYGQYLRNSAIHYQQSIHASTIGLFSLKKPKPKKQPKQFDLDKEAFYNSQFEAFEQHRQQMITKAQVIDKHLPFIHIVTFMRRVLELFRFAGEAEIVERVSEIISQVYFNTYHHLIPMKDRVYNVKFPFLNRDAVLILVYSIIILNTDLHNESAQNAASSFGRMKKEDYIRNLRGTNEEDGVKHDFPYAFLSDIYDTVATCSIQVAEDLVNTPRLALDRWQLLTQSTPHHELQCTPAEIKTLHGQPPIPIGTGPAALHISKVDGGDSADTTTTGSGFTPAALEPFLEGNDSVGDTPSPLYGYCSVPDPLEHADIYPVDTYYPPSYAQLKISCNPLRTVMAGHMGFQRLLLHRMNVSNADAGSDHDGDNDDDAYSDDGDDHYHVTGGADGDETDMITDAALLLVFTSSLFRKCIIPIYQAINHHLTAVTHLSTTTLAMIGSSRPHQHQQCRAYEQSIVAYSLQLINSLTAILASHDELYSRLPSHNSVSKHASSASPHLSTSITTSSGTASTGLMPSSSHSSHRDWRFHGVGSPHAIGQLSTILYMITIPHIQYRIKNALFITNNDFITKVLLASSNQSGILSQPASPPAPMANYQPSPASGAQPSAGYPVMHGPSLSSHASAHSQQSSGSGGGNNRFGALFESSSRLIASILAGPEPSTETLSLVVPSLSNFPIQIQSVPLLLVHSHTQSNPLALAAFNALLYFTALDTKSHYVQPLTYYTTHYFIPSIRKPITIQPSPMVKLHRDGQGGVLTHVHEYGGYNTTTKLVVGSLTQQYQHVHQGDGVSHLTHTQSSHQRQSATSLVMVDNPHNAAAPFTPSILDATTAPPTMAASDQPLRSHPTRMSWSWSHPSRVNNNNYVDETYSLILVPPTSISESVTIPSHPGDVHQASRAAYSNREVQYGFTPPSVPTLNTGGFTASHLFLLFLNSHNDHALLHQLERQCQASPVTHTKSDKDNHTHTAHKVSAIITPAALSLASNVVGMLLTLSTISSVPRLPVASKHVYPSLLRLMYSLYTVGLFPSQFYRSLDIDNAPHYHYKPTDQAKQIGNTDNSGEFAAVADASSTLELVPQPDPRLGSLGRRGSMICRAPFEVMARSNGQYQQLYSPESSTSGIVTSILSSFTSLFWGSAATPSSSQQQQHIQPVSISTDQLTETTPQRGGAPTSDQRQSTSSSSATSHLLSSEASFASYVSGAMTQVVNPLFISYQTGVFLGDADTYHDSQSHALTDRPIISKTSAWQPIEEPFLTTHLQSPTTTPFIQHTATAHSFPLLSTRQYPHLKTDTILHTVLPRHSVLALSVLTASRQLQLPHIIDLVRTIPSQPSTIVASSSSLPSTSRLAHAQFPFTHYPLLMRFSNLMNIALGCFNDHVTVAEFLFYNRVVVSLLDHLIATTVSVHHLMGHSQYTPNLASKQLNGRSFSMPTGDQSHAMHPPTPTASAATTSITPSITFPKISTQTATAERRSNSSTYATESTRFEHNHNQFDDAITQYRYTLVNQLHSFLLSYINITMLHLYTIFHELSRLYQKISTTPELLIRQSQIYDQSSPSDPVSLSLEGRQWSGASSEPDNDWNEGDTSFDLLSTEFITPARSDVFTSSMRLTSSLASSATVTGDKSSSAHQPFNTVDGSTTHQSPDKTVAIWTRYHQLQVVFETLLTTVLRLPILVSDKVCSNPVEKALITSVILEVYTRLQDMLKPAPHTPSQHAGGKGDTPGSASESSKQVSGITTNPSTPRGVHPAPPASAAAGGSGSTAPATQNTLHKDSIGQTYGEYILPLYAPRIAWSLGQFLLSHGSFVVTVQAWTTITSFIRQCIAPYYQSHQYLAHALCDAITGGPTTTALTAMVTVDSFIPLFTLCTELISQSYAQVDGALAIMDQSVYESALRSVSHASPQPGATENRQNASSANSGTNVKDGVPLAHSNRATPGEQYIPTCVHLYPSILPDDSHGHHATDVIAPSGNPSVASIQEHLSRQMTSVNRTKAKLVHCMLRMVQHLNTIVSLANEGDHVLHTSSTVLPGYSNDFYLNPLYQSIARLITSASHDTSRQHSPQAVSPLHPTLFLPVLSHLFSRGTTRSPLFIGEGSEHTTAHSRGLSTFYTETFSMCIQQLTGLCAMTPSHVVPTATTTPSSQQQHPHQQQQPVDSTLSSSSSSLIVIKSPTTEQIYPQLACLRAAAVVATIDLCRFRIQSTLSQPSTTIPSIVSLLAFVNNKIGSLVAHSIRSIFACSHSEVIAYGGVSDGQQRLSSIQWLCHTLLVSHFEMIMTLLKGLVQQHTQSHNPQQHQQQQQQQTIATSLQFTRSWLEFSQTTGLVLAHLVKQSTITVKQPNHPCHRTVLALHRLLHHLITTLFLGVSGNAGATASPSSSSQSPIMSSIIHPLSGVLSRSDVISVSLIYQNGLPTGHSAPALPPINAIPQALTPLYDPNLLHALSASLNTTIYPRLILPQQQQHQLESPSRLSEQQIGGLLVSLFLHFAKLLPKQTRSDVLHTYGLVDLSQSQNLPPSTTAMNPQITPPHATPSPQAALPSSSVIVPESGSESRPHAP